MTNISKDLALIINLSNTAIWHCKHCADEQCNVSLFELKETAKMILAKMRVLKYDNEIKEATKIISEMP